MTYFVYVLRCRDDSLYTGIALDVAARVARHAAGKGAKYTRGRGPFVVVAKARCPSKGDALRLERAVKALPRPVKQSLTPRRLAALGVRLRTRKME